MFSNDFVRNQGMLERLLRPARSFDILTREVCMQGKTARIYFVDGMIQDDTLNKILDLLLQMPENVMNEAGAARQFANTAVPYGEVDVCVEEQDFVTFVLSGCVGLLVEGFGEGLLLDVRAYPARPVMEPENDRVLRGPREGFVETLIHNTAMLRRRIRDPRLTMELLQVGLRSHTDIVLCYLDGVADERIIQNLREKLRGIRVNTLTMGLESLTECMSRGQWWNPFPRARTTERPDCAAAGVAEGQIMLLMDGTPAGMILPTGIFDFLQDTNDYCFLPVTGAYLRWLRMVVGVLTTVLTPLWYFSLTHAGLLPDWLEFLKIHKPIGVPVLLQFLLIELVIGTLKLASLNTPSALSGSFAVVGAMVLGQFAVESELMMPETLLVMAFVAIANFAQPSYELGYALGFTRVTMLVLTALFGLWGLLGGVALLLLVVSVTKTVAGTSYWYPLIPWNSKALGRLFLRRPISRENS